MKYCVPGILLLAAASCATAADVLVENGRARGYIVVPEGTDGRVLEAGVRFTGCSVHVVRAEVDDGPIIAQAVIPVGADDTIALLPPLGGG